MLQAGIDVTFGVVSGILEDDDNYRYAFFSGNTLYGRRGHPRNTTDMIVEFFWFESSIERGSDLVAVVKARIHPEPGRGWKDGRRRARAELARRDLQRHGRRLPLGWSLPLSPTGGTHTGRPMESAYGLNTNAEGASMVAFEYKNKEDAAGGSVTEVMTRFSPRAT